MLARGVQLVPVMEAQMKSCNVCKSSYCSHAWAELPLIGIQLSDEDGVRYSLELRNCTCGSTLGIETVLR
jgi:hypothetical protein